MAVPVKFGYVATVPAKIHYFQMLLRSAKSGVSVCWFQELEMAIDSSTMSFFECGGVNPRIGAGEEMDVFYQE